MSFQDLEAGRPFNLRQSAYTNGARQQDPTQAIAIGIFQLDTAVSSFQRLVSTLGTRRENPDLQEKLHNRIIHIGQLVKDTSAKLEQASKIEHCSEVRAEKKIIHAKQAKRFEKALKDFQRAQRLATERETTYTPFVAHGDHPSSPEIHSSEKCQEQCTLLVPYKRQEISLPNNEIVFTEAIIEGRDYGTQELKQDISDLNETFKNLSVLVHVQGLTIDAMSSNIENIHASTSQALTQLSEATQFQSTRFSIFKSFFTAAKRALTTVVPVIVIGVPVIVIVICITGVVLLL